MAFGDKLRALMAERQVGLRELAKLVPCDPGHLSKVSRGRKRPSAKLVERLDELLDARGELIALTPRPTGRPTGDDPADPALWVPERVVEDIARTTLADLSVTRRDAGKQVGALLVGAALTEQLEPWITQAGRPASPRRKSTVGLEEVERIEAWTRLLRHWDSRFRLGIRRKAVIGQLNEIADLLSTPQGAEVTRRLFAVLAELAKVAASMSFDAGQHPVAQRYYRLSLRASHAAGDRLFGANILGAMARQMLDLHRPDDALDLVRLALDGVRGDTPGRVRAMLRTREGWAYAQMGRVQAFHRTVAIAEEEFGADSGRPMPYWVTRFDQAELAGVIGARYRDLALARARAGADHRAIARRSVEYITTALQLRPPQRLRNRAFDLVGLGRACLLVDEREQAAQAVREAARICGTIRSGRVRRRLGDFYAESARYADASVIADVRAELKDRFHNDMKEHA